MANQKRVDKEAAIALRKQGLQYKEISTILGCSEAWCFKNLADVEKGNYIHNEDGNVVKTRAIEILQNALKEVRKL